MHAYTYVKLANNTQQKHAGMLKQHAEMCNFNKKCVNSTVSTLVYSTQIAKCAVLAFNAIFAHQLVCSFDS